MICNPETFRRYQDMIDSIDTEFAVEQYKMETKYNEGLRKGEKVGEKKGRAEEKLDNAKAMKSLGLSTETIVKVTGLSIAEIEEL